MYEDIVYMVFLVLEVAVLIFFIYYIAKYFKQYQEKVDPYTKTTLILLVFSFLFQFMRLPLKIMQIISESNPDSDSSFNLWYKESLNNITIAIKVIVFCHGNL